MSAASARKLRVVHVVRTQPEGYRRARRHAKVPTAADVNEQRIQLLEDALSQGLQRLADVADALDRIEKVTRDKVDRFGVLIERYRAQVKRGR